MQNRSPFQNDSKFLFITSRTQTKSRGLLTRFWWTERSGPEISADSRPPSSSPKPSFTTYKSILSSLSLNGFQGHFIFFDFLFHLAHSKAYMHYWNNLFILPHKTLHASYVLVIYWTWSELILNQISNQKWGHLMSVGKQLVIQDLMLLLHLL